MTDIYYWNPILILIIMIALLVLWVILDRKIRNQKIWKIINVVLAIVAIVGILIFTVFGRTSDGEHEFRFFAYFGKHFFREMIMNLFLFFPLGLTLPFVFPERIRLRVVFVWIIAFCISIAIEAWQYMAGTGLSQGTDVIMNTLGAAVGSAAEIVSRVLKKE